MEPVAQNRQAQNMQFDGGEDFSQKRYTFSIEEKSEILSKVRKFLDNCQQIRFAFVHGSFLGDLPCRDIDIAAYFDPLLTAEDIFDLSLTLSAALTALLPLPADVHALNLAKNSFCYHATQGMLLMFRDYEEAHDFIEKTWINYMDFQTLARQILKDLLD